MKTMLSSISTTNDETERLLGFSDAVFAIAMTFLALDLGAVPDDVGRPGGPTTVDFLHENIPDYVVYFGTFLVVGFLWWRHHLMFRYIKRNSGGILWTNTLMLALVAMLPYPASVLSEAPGSGLALLMLLVPLTAIGLLMWLQWELAVHGHLVIPGLPKPYISYVRAQVMASPIVLALASGAAAYSWLNKSTTANRIAFAMWTLLIILPIVLRRFFPAPDQAYEVKVAALPETWQSLEETEQEETKRIRGLLARLRNGSDTDRIKVLTDGVVAIAVTILALQLRPPPTTEAINDETILENLYAVPAWTYFVTFVLISLFWRGHVRIFTYLQGADPVVLWLNLFFLMFMSFLPTAAAISAQDQGTTALAFYLLMMFFTGAAMAVLGQYGSRAKNLTVELGTETQRMIATLRAVTAVSAFLIALILVVVFDNPALSNVIWVIFILSGQLSRYLRHREMAQSTATAATG